MVAAHSLDGSDARELVERRGAIHVPRVEDDLDSVEDPEKLVGQALEKLRAVCVRDDADAGGYLIPAATSPAACAADASCPVSSARMAGFPPAWARCWSTLGSMFAIAD